jgi:seryl-tRNA(Sec) selenium transferase
VKKFSIFIYLFIIIVLFTNLDDFEYAQHKAEKAQTTDLLTSNDESLVLKKKRCTKKISKKTEKSRFASSSSDEITASDDDSNEYPVQFENFDGNSIIYR